MAEAHERLDITPRVIETGSHVIQLAHVTSAGFGTVHPFRPAGLALIALALASLGYTFVQGGAAAFALSNAGSPLLWVAFAAAGVGLFLSVFARRYLIVRTIDGARTTLPAGDDDASAVIIARIRTAMETAEASATAIRDQTKSLESAIEAPLAITTEPATPARAALPERTQKPATFPIATRTNPTLNPAQTQPLGHLRRPEGYVNGHDHAAQPADPFQLPADTHEQARHHAPQQATTPAQSPAAIGYSRQSSQTTPAAASMQHERAAPARTYEPQPAHAPQPTPLPVPTPRDDPAKDLHTLIEHVRRADLQHKEALLDLLRVVDDHYRGRASREDSQAHWRSFADYVVQYLSDVDGLLEATERFGRHMVAR